MKLEYYTIATVIARTPERAIAYDFLNNPVRFTKDDMRPEEWLAISPGSRVILNPDNSIELASGAFRRYSEENPVD
jgi:hypothetical protein